MDSRDNFVSKRRTRQRSGDFDLSCPKENEEGKKESNQGIVHQLAVEGEKHKKGQTYLVRPRSLSMSKKKKLNHGNCSSPILLNEDEESDDEDSKCSSEVDFKVDNSVKNVVVQKDALRISGKKILDDHNNITPPEEQEQVPIKETLPLIFRFEDEEPLPPEKDEWEKEIDHLFVEMDMCVLESHIGFTNPSDSPMQSGQISDCPMENHHLVLDEQIGLICSVCSYVHLESKYILPPLAQRTPGKYDRKYFGESPSLLDVNGFRLV